jgi:hypothetical protein
MPPQICLRKHGGSQHKSFLAFGDNRKPPGCPDSSFWHLLPGSSPVVVHEKGSSRGTPSGMCSLIACGEKVHLGSSDRLGSWSGQRLTLASF